MSAHDNLPRSQFGSIIFPGEAHVVDGEYRHHIHEYPHSPGGAPEKLGRKLYRVQVRAPFHNTFPAYPNLYPEGMNTMRGYFEQGVTLPFTHPTVGTFPAFITRWRQSKSAKVRSGETVDFDVLEDQGPSFALTDTVVQAGPTALQPTADQLASDLEQVRAQLTLSHNDISVFDALQAAVSAVLAVQDTKQLYSNLFAAKIEQTISLCQQLDASMNLQDPRAWPLVDDIQAIWVQAQRISNDLHQTNLTLQHYTVPFTMPVLQIAINLYGDASRQGDILSLNSNKIDDPLRVPAGTDIQYYPRTPQDTIASAA